MLLYLALLLTAVCAVEVEYDVGDAFAARELIRAATVALSTSTPLLPASSLPKFHIVKEHESVHVRDAQDHGVVVGEEVYCVGDAHFSVPACIEEVLGGHLDFSSGWVFSRPKLNLVPRTVEFRARFSVRGLHPFHDFFSGVDLWTASKVEQLTYAMWGARMNGFGLHAYCKDENYCEPTLFVGLPNAVGEDGTVDPAVAYNTSYANTLRGGDWWGYQPRNTSAFPFGLWRLFEHACYAHPEVQPPSRCPTPVDGAASSAQFAAAAELWGGALRRMRNLKFRTVLGAQAPLTQWFAANVTNATKADYFEGAFRWLDKAGIAEGMSEYWVYFPEQWTFAPTRVNSTSVQEVLGDCMAAQEALERANVSFLLATCGWALGPSENRSYFDKTLNTEQWSFVSTLDGQLGTQGVEPALNHSTHPGWDIPWLEDDPHLTVQQMWVGRVLERMQQGQAFGLEGMLGIHWRIREIAAELFTLSHYSWERTYTYVDTKTSTTKTSTTKTSTTKTSTTPPLPSVIEAYTAWAEGMFGEKIAPDLAALLAALDGTVPRPVDWNSNSGDVLGGPGSFGFFDIDCSFNYTFLDSLLALAPKAGAPNTSTRARYDDYVSSFSQSRSTAQAECAWWELSQLVTHANSLPPSQRQQFANDTMLPALGRLVANVSTLMTHAYAKLGDSGDLGILVNIATHSFPGILEAATQAVQTLLPHTPIPARFLPPTDFPASTTPRLVLPLLFTSHNTSLPIPIQALLLAPADQCLNATVTALWREMGAVEWKKVEVPRVQEPGRCVFRGNLPPRPQNSTIEYVVQAVGVGSHTLMQPIGRTQSVTPSPEL